MIIDNLGDNSFGEVISKLGEFHRNNGYLNKSYMEAVGDLLGERVAKRIAQEACKTPCVHTYGSGQRYAIQGHSSNLGSPGTHLWIQDLEMNEKISSVVEDSADNFQTLMVVTEGLNRGDYGDTSHLIGISL